MVLVNDGKPSGSILIVPEDVRLKIHSALFKLKRIVDNATFECSICLGTIKEPMCSLDVIIHFAVLASRIVFGNAVMNVQNVERPSSHNGICKKILSMTIWYVLLHRKKCMNLYLNIVEQDWKI
eukprot:865245_1